MVSWGHADLGPVHDLHEGSHEAILCPFVSLHPRQIKSLAVPVGIW